MLLRVPACHWLLSRGGVVLVFLVLWIGLWLGSQSLSILQKWIGAARSAKNGPTAAETVSGAPRVHDRHLGR